MCRLSRDVREALNRVYAPATILFMGAMRDRRGVAKGELEVTVLQFLLWFFF
jgi:hypothetical protein